MLKGKNILFFLTLVGVIGFPLLGFCSVESSLMAVQSKLIGTILPLAAIIGLVFAGLSFVAGDWPPYLVPHTSRDFRLQVA